MDCWLLHIIWDEAGEETWNYLVFEKDYGDHGLALKLENANSDAPLYFDRSAG